ncbi:hypothetical protein ABK040_003333 [Willaertia magna]
MSEIHVERKFIDETNKVKRRETEMVFLKRTLKNNQKKGRIRKSLLNKALLQNYFEFSSNNKNQKGNKRTCGKSNNHSAFTCCGNYNNKSNSNSNNATVKFEVKNLSPEHCVVSCTRVVSKNKLETRAVDSNTTLNTNRLSNNEDLKLAQFNQQYSSPSNDNQTLITSSSYDDHLYSPNDKGLILVSDYFHLQLDVDDFIKSYNALVKETNNNTFQL